MNKTYTQDDIIKILDELYTDIERSLTNRMMLKRITEDQHDMLVGVIDHNMNSTLHKLSKDKTT